MRALVFVVVSVPLLIAGSVAAPGQPRGSTSDAVTPALSSSNPTGTSPSDYLRTAQTALTAGRIGDAEDALERAQTRMLDRSVPLGQTNDPSDNTTIGQISEARHALASRDKAACLQLIQAAIASASAQGF